MNQKIEKKHVFVEERLQSITDLVNQLGRVTVSELCDEFNVSASTIRNDLLTLEKENRLLRTHGGALSNASLPVGTEYTPDVRSVEQVEEKKQIAQKAHEFISDNDVIALTYGTTLLELAKLLPYKKNLTITVNDLTVASWLEQNTDHKIYILGGFIRNRFHFINFLDQEVEILNIDKVFFSSTSFHLDRGACTSDFNLARSQAALINRSQKNFLLCDSSKFGNISFAQILPPDEIDYIITDPGIKNFKDYYQKLKVSKKLILASDL